MASEQLNNASDEQVSDGQEGPSISYVNEVVLKGLGEWGIRITASCEVTNDRSLSAKDFLALLTEHGWSWPAQWYRQNRNYFQHNLGAAHLEKEVENGRWIHIVVSPGLSRKPRLFGFAPKVGDWALPPRNVELHAEHGWLRPSSFEHLWSFLKKKLWPFQEP
jgi:hypothetical protein